MLRPVGLRSVAIALISLLFTLIPFSITAQTTPAESVLERVAQSGVLNAGSRVDAPPFAYIDAEGNWVGYSIDMLHLIQQDLERQVQKPIRLNLVEVNVADWLPKLGQGEIDIVCGSTSITASRALYVDFSVGYFKTGTQFLIKNGRPLSPPELRIGVVRGASDEYSVEDQLRLARLTRFSSRAEGLKALIANQIDALASDGILLEGMRQTLPNRETFSIVPAQPLGVQVYGCALPQQDNRFRALVNRQLIGFMQGVVKNAPISMKLFDTWFGATGVAPIDRDQALSYFQQTIESYEQSQN